MKTRCIVLLAALLSPPAHGQLVVDGQTRILNGVSSNVIGSLIVGTNGSFTRLIVTNAAKLTNSTTGFIGGAATARSNSVVVTGLNSLWFSGTSITVGSAGSFNDLRVLNGGWVYTPQSYIGFLSGAHSNMALVSGSGSYWTNRDALYVGESGSWNHLVISNRGYVADYFGIIGGGGSNRVTVTGPMSYWVNNQLWAGDGGRGNQVLIMNGGAVFNVDASIGRGSTNDRDTKVIVTGPGSAWHNQRNLVVGNLSPANQVLVTNGGLVVSAISTVGDSSYAFSNAVVVTGTNSQWYSTSNTYVGWDGRGNSVTVTDGGLAVGRHSYLGRNSTLSSNNVATVTGPGSSWTNTGDFVVGTVSSGNQLRISNGGYVANAAGFVGDAGSNNFAEVSDMSSRWENRNNLYVGRSGSGNRLLVRDGGRVTNFNAILGDTVSSRSNMATVVGAGNLGTERDLVLGYLGTGNQLVITNSGTASARDGYIGYLGGAVANRVTVTGFGSALTRLVFLHVGYFGGANRLEIRDGGLIESVNAYLGTSNAVPGQADANIALVGDPGSRWRLSSSLYVGAASSLNQLIISNGATVQSLSGLVGFEPAAANNRVVITGPGSVWTNQSGVVLGSRGPGNQLYVTNGGGVIGGFGILGQNAATSHDNYALVSGSNSFWRTSADLWVGLNGSANTLVLSTGALATANRLLIGLRSISSNNAVGVAAASLIITQATDVAGGTLGLGGGCHMETDFLAVTSGVASRIFFGGGTLITRGGRVHHVDSSGLILPQAFVVGDSGSGNGPAVLDVRAGQPFEVTSNLFVIGRAPSNCRLYLTNGGTLRVTGGGADYGAGASLMSANPGGPDLGSTGNVAVVSGTNSLWESQGALYVGFLNSGNQLVVSNGGTVIARNVFVGLSGSASNNTLTLAGGLLRATNASGGAVDVQGGLLRVAGGSLLTDQLRLNNGTRSGFSFPGGVISTRSTACMNGSPFVVGDGLSPAALELAGDGTHSYADGLMISSNGLLKGNGSVLGNVAVAGGGTFAPGTSIGRININGSLVLAGSSTNVFELNKSAGTNDHVTGLNSVTYGGTLQLASLGGTLAAGDTFKLFQASSYSNNFNTVLPSSPGSGLRWNLHRLPVDGVLRVLSLTSAPPHINSVTRSMDTNLLIAASGGVPYDPVVLLTSTNLFLPTATWQRLATNHFDAAGNINLTNLVLTTEPQRFFRLQVE